MAERRGYRGSGVDGRKNYEYKNVFYSEDPLWDGQGCGKTSNCCNFHRPLWFCKEHPEPTRDDLKVRICGNTYTSFGDTPVELVELYIH